MNPFEIRGAPWCNLFKAHYTRFKRACDSWLSIPEELVHDAHLGGSVKHVSLQRRLKGVFIGNTQTRFDVLAHA